MPKVTANCPGIASIGLLPHTYEVTIRTGGFAPLKVVCPACIEQQRVNNIMMGMTTTLIPPRFIQTDCLICMDTFKSNTFVCGLHCGHAFHPSCIIPWIEGKGMIGIRPHAAQGIPCPSCRQPIIGGIMGLQKYKVP